MSSKIANIRDISSKNRLIIFGESHGYLRDILVEEKLIKKFKPKYYLWEMLENKQIIAKRDFNRFLSMPDDKDFSVISKYGELKSIIRLAKKYKMKVIGCDLKNMERKDRSFLKKKKKLIKTEQEFENKLLKKRELHQAKIIKKYLLKTKKTIFVSIGAYHLRKNSYLLKCLKGKDVLIYQPLFKGKKVFGPGNRIDVQNIIYTSELKHL